MILRTKRVSNVIMGKLSAQVWCCLQGNTCTMNIAIPPNSFEKEGFPELHG